jgi:hypothetical protein
VNVVEILHTCVYKNGKMRPVETISGIGAAGVKENDGGRMNSTLICCKSSLNVTIYLQDNNKKRSLD